VAGEVATNEPEPVVEHGDFGPVCVSGSLRVEIARVAWLVSDLKVYHASRPELSAVSMIGTRLTSVSIYPSAHNV